MHHFRAHAWGGARHCALRCRKPAVLKCWSDGALTVAQLVDLHGRNGFDVLCVTDHVVRGDDPWRGIEGGRHRSIEQDSFTPYLADVELEAERAWETYGLLVVPGLPKIASVSEVLAT